MPESFSDQMPWFMIEVIEMKKRFGIFLAAFCISLGLCFPGDIVQAASGKTSVSVSKDSVNIGDTVTVTVKASGPAGEKANATMTLSYDSGVLQFVSCNTTYGGGGNSVIATGESYTVTLKAVGAGKSALSVSGNDGVIFDTNEEMDSMSGSSASVTVNNAAGTGAASGGNAGTAGASGGNSGTQVAAGNAAAGGTAAGSNTGTAGAGAEEPKSADNSLKSLTISPGTLSPEFYYKTTTYSAAVGSDVNSIAVSAVAANEKAVVESVTGNDNLKAGSNAIKIVVKAENGVTATYTINVTKQASAPEEPKTSEKEEEPEEEPDPAETASELVAVDGVSYRITEEFPQEDIPSDFAENEISYHGNTYKGVSFNKGSLHMLWMVQADTEASGSFFIYDEARDWVYPFVKLGGGERYVIALQPPADAAMPENYVQTAVPVDGTGNFTAYQKTAEEGAENMSDFYLFYAINHEGTTGWYQYDALEGTYQRLSAPVLDAGEEEADADTGSDMEYLQEEYTALSEQYKQEKVFARNTIAVLVFVIAVLVIVIINLLLHEFRKKNDDIYDDYDDYDEDEDEDSLADDPEENLEDEKESSGGSAERKVNFPKLSLRKKREELFEDDFEDDYEEEKESFGDREIVSGEEKSVYGKQQEQETYPVSPENEKPVKKTKEKKAKKTKEDDDLEIIDFNDL